MGACNIEFYLKGRASELEIDRAFKKRQKEDEYENGHQSGYSGDFQTVNKVDYTYLNNTDFTDLKKASDFCLEKSKKWDTVVAVYVRNTTLVAGWGAC